MKYLRLGNTGLKVSEICMGCMSFGRPTENWHSWVLPEDQSRPLVKKALDAGINFFDTANVYAAGSSEEITGRLLKEMVKREDVVIATKVCSPMGKGPNSRGLSRKAIFQEVDASLKRLQTDYIDLYQTHRWDFDTPIAETLEALHDVVKAGKVRYLGASSMHAYQFSKALYLADQHGWTRFVSMQPYYNLLYREEEREMLRLCREENVGVIPWSPLARGRLTRPWSEREDTARAQTDQFGKTLYKASEEPDRPIVDHLEATAKARGLSMAQLALAWVRMQPGITAPIVGVTKMQHLADALTSTNVTLSAEEIKLLEAPYVPHPVSGFMQAPSS